MTELGLLSEELGVSERTLRRAVRQGTLRATRPSPRTLHVSLAERREDAEMEPALMSEIASEGRVLIDRDHRWPDLVRRAQTRQGARRRQRARTPAALAGIERMLST